jgi:aspartate aminotransferase
VISPSAEVSSFLEPQERFERMRAHHLRRTGGRLIDLAYPNADVTPPAVLAILRETLASLTGRDLQYTPYGGAVPARRAVAHALRKSSGIEFGSRDVLLTPGAMSALSIALASVYEEGAEAIVVTPCWLDTPTYVCQQRLRLVTVQSDRASGKIDPQAIARAMNERTRAVVIAQPSNPTGVAMDESSLRALSMVLSSAERPPLLISDECHRDFVFGEGFVTPARFYPRTAIVHSFGKRWQMQGQRLGYLAFSPALGDEGWSDRAIRLCRAMGHATPTALMQRALPDLLRLEVDVSEIARRREIAARVLASAGYSVMPGKHTMFVYADAPDGGDDMDFAEETARAGVLVMPSSVFLDRGRFRIAVTASDGALARGLDALGALRRKAA